MSRGTAAATLLVALGFSCQDGPAQSTTERTAATNAATRSVAAEPVTRARVSPVRGELRCEHLRAVHGPAPQHVETIEIQLPEADKRIVLSKTGVLVTFSRDDFLVVARCLKLQQALRYIQEEMGQARESPLRDAFQLSYVAAAVMDLGRISVRLQGEDVPKTSIVRGWWSEDGCAGGCRATGRSYRLAESDQLFFFKVADKTENISKTTR